jgi:NAD(P)H-quinone oxidoreductase subunit 5
VTVLFYSITPLILTLAALVACTGSAVRPRLITRLSEAAAVVAILFSLIQMGVLLSDGPSTGPLIGWEGFGFAARLDALSVTMTLLVCFVGWVVLRFARTYLDGERGQARFTAWMCLTIAAVLFLVQAGNLVQLVVAWIATSFLLVQLLLFYRDRPQAQRAARKKFVIARVGDAAIVGAGVLLATGFGTGDIAEILTQARVDAPPHSAAWAAGFLALAAVLKSAQFPAHGWLTEVMEAPTPVSAMLHAGLINAGGFLLIRFADVMLLSPGVLAILVFVGGFTALFGGIVMLTQPAVKTSLAWSTIAQMGFMIFQCGLALFPLALLHIVAHSLYKAHAFLSSGSAVEGVASIARPGPPATPDVRAVLKAFALAIGIYVILGTLAGFTGKSTQAIALGGILIFGVAYMLAQGLADRAPGPLTKRTIVYALATAVGYFALQSAAVWAMDPTLPATPEPGPLEWALMVMSLVSFGAVALAQALFPLWAQHPAAQGLRVHLSNGLYVNALLDRMLGGWTTKTPK